MLLRMYNINLWLFLINNTFFILFISNKWRVSTCSLIDVPIGTDQRAVAKLAQKSPRGVGGLKPYLSFPKSFAPHSYNISFFFILIYYEVPNNESVRDLFPFTNKKSNKQ